MASGKFQSDDAVSLSYTVSFPPSGHAKSVIVFVHGLGDHARSLTYSFIPEILLKNGYAVFGYDLRGHGSSDGERCHIDRFEHHRTDLAAAIREAVLATGCSRVYLLASSMGGLIAFDQVINDPGSVAGVVAIAPALTASGASTIVRILVPIVARILPKVKIDPGLDLSSISRDEEAVKQYTGDPKFSTRLTLRAASEIMRAVSRVNSELSRISTPMLILHGSMDKIVPPESSASAFDAVGTKEKNRIVYPQARHNLLIEINRDQVYSDILDWLSSREERSTQR